LIKARVGQVALPIGALDNPTDAYNTVQTITNSADLVISGNATQGQMPNAMWEELSGVPCIRTNVPSRLIK
jgi:hypothetical protein